MYKRDISTEFFKMIKMYDQTFDQTILSNRAEMQQYGEISGDPARHSQAFRERTLLKKSVVTTDKPTIVKVPLGTRLWHASTIESFDPDNIILGSTFSKRKQKMAMNAMRGNIDRMSMIHGKNDTFIYLTSDKHLAIQSIGGCSNLLYNPYEQSGYIHEFMVVNEIDGISVVSQENLNNIDILNKYRIEYCSNTLDQTARNGFMYFINKKDFSHITGQDITQGEQATAQTQGVELSPTDTPHYAVIEIGLCNPNKYLQYVGSYRCNAPRRLSDMYNFYSNNSDYITNSEFIQRQATASLTARGTRR